MSFVNDCNLIADQLRRKKEQRKVQRYVVGPRIKIDVPSGVYMLTTRDAAKALNRKEQTLRGWACMKNGPILPINIGGRLAWRVSDIEALLNGDLTLQPSGAGHEHQDA